MNMKLLHHIVSVALFVVSAGAFTTTPRVYSSVITQTQSTCVPKSTLTSPMDSSSWLARSISLKRQRVFQHYAAEDGSSSISESDQTVLGVLGTVSSLIVFYSEYVLKTTGCGLPAGPFGLFGLAEGISYLGVIGIGGYSLYTKAKTGSGLPAGPGGVLGAAEGLSFLAIVGGLVVLGFQVANYGYVPNAVPMEGGMCS